MLKSTVWVLYCILCILVSVHVLSFRRLLNKYHPINFQEFFGSPNGRCASGTWIGYSTAFLSSPLGHAPMHIQWHHAECNAPRRRPPVNKRSHHLDFHCLCAAQTPCKITLQSPQHHNPTPCVLASNTDTPFRPPPFAFKLIFGQRKLLSSTTSLSILPCTSFFVFEFPFTSPPPLTLKQRWPSSVPSSLRSAPASPVLPSLPRAPPLPSSPCAPAGQSRS